MRGPAPDPGLFVQHGRDLASCNAMQYPKGRERAHYPDQTRLKPETRPHPASMFCFCFRRPFLQDFNLPSHLQNFFLFSTDTQVQVPLSAATPSKLEIAFGKPPAAAAPAV